MGYAEVAPGQFSKVKKAKETVSAKNTSKSPYSHVKRPIGKYTINGEERIIHFRSKWEFVVAEFLEHQKKTGQIKFWDYEPKKFHFTQSDSPKANHKAAYLPDFYVEEKTGSHYWIEVKGHLSKRAAAQLNRMAKEYPEEEVRVWKSQEVRKLRSLGFGASAK